MLTIFSTRTCVYCKHVAKYFQMKKVEFQTVYVDDDLEQRRFLAEKTGYTAVPITTDGNTYVVGWNVRALNDLIASV